MNNYRGIIMFSIALFAAVGAVLIAAKWLQQRSTQVTQVEEGTGNNKNTKDISKIVLEHILDY